MTADLQRPAPAHIHHRCTQTTRTLHLRLASGCRLHARRQRHCPHARTSPCCDSRPGASEPSRDPSLPPDVPRAVPPATWNPFKNTKKEVSLHTNRLFNMTFFSASCCCLACAIIARQRRYIVFLSHDGMLDRSSNAYTMLLCRMQHVQLCKICSRARMTC